MKSRKVHNEIAASSRNIILDIVKKYPNGILSAEITKLTGLDYRHVTRILISLRDNGAVFSYRIAGTANLNRWTTVGRPVTAENAPCPNLDSEHEEWQKVVTAPKIKYNPWERQ